MERTLSLIVVLMVVLGSCLDQPDCFRLNNNYAGVTFKLLSTNKSTVFDSVTVTEVETDTAFASGAVTSRVVLRLNYFKDMTAYEFQLGDETYELVLGYRSQAQFVSSDCGERFVLSDLVVASHSFDSVRLVNAVPGVNSETDNIEIFF